MAGTSSKTVDGIRLVQLNPSITEANSDIDIIAIHGLDTKSPETWTWNPKDGSNRKPVFWLGDADMLPSQVGATRIFTCDWPANSLQASTSVPMTLRELGRLLLAGIQSSISTKKRHIMFIASCLGGVVLMEALVTADHPRSEYYQIRKATKGIIFLATPFRGTAFASVASWAILYQKLAVYLQDQVVSRLLENVKESTPDLQDLVRGFTRMCKDEKYPCDVFNFYETETTDLERKLYPKLVARWFGKPKLVCCSMALSRGVE
jgi:hypothetical protein